MIQKKKESLQANNTISIPKQISEINQNLNDVEYALKANADIIKNKVTKQRRLIELKDETLKELKDIPNELLDAENWENLKKSAICEIKETNGRLNKFGKYAKSKSSQVFSEGKDFVSTNTPKISKSVSKHLKRFFEKNQSFTSKDIDLLKQLSELKQNEIISAKEFSEAKKKILAKI
ncbi:hypothetical protein [Nitrosopumilus sp.]|uniref:hypothetical protein n=1 Tax=Nitrosopumilus sp. TaxID=2024843 RepID=UPI00247BBA23|nr:hypothetical protein [Nitrosopumilus sp.]MCV0430313.1 hypothetical protein [Nitrosopumilus sp.]